MIRIWNNGKGIPVVNHKVENVYVPTLIFGHLLTSSNYDDSERKVTGGRNGYGAKLCNIFSTKFIVETSSKEYKKSFRQVWIDNMTKTSEPKISTDKDEDFTCITFYPDLQRFGMTELEADTVALFQRRAYDMAATTNGVKVFLNGKRLPIKSFVDYVDLYIKANKEDDSQIKVSSANHPDILPIICFVQFNVFVSFHRTSLRSTYAHPNAKLSRYLISMSKELGHLCESKLIFTSTSVLLSLGSRRQ